MGHRSVGPDGSRTGPALLIVSGLGGESVQSGHTLLNVLDTKYGSFVVVVANEQWYLDVIARLCKRSVGGRVQNKSVIDGRVEILAFECGEYVGVIDAAHAREHGGCIRRCIAAAKLICDVIPDPGTAGSIERREKGSGAGLENKASNDRVGSVGISIQINRVRTSGLTEENDTCRVSTKIGNVVADPFDSKSLVEKSNILTLLACWYARKTEYVNTIAVERSQLGRSPAYMVAPDLLEADHNHIFLISQILTIVQGIVRVARCEGTSIYPDHHRLERWTGLWLRPNVYGEAVLANKDLSICCGQVISSCSQVDIWCLSGAVSCTGCLLHDWTSRTLNCP